MTSFQPPPHTLSAPEGKGVAEGQRATPGGFQNSLSGSHSGLPLKVASSYTRILLSRSPGASCSAWPISQSVCCCYWGWRDVGEGSPVCLFNILRGSIRKTGIKGREKDCSATEAGNMGSTEKLLIYLQGR